MRYQIRFIEGELLGQTFPIGANALSVGRSHSNEIKLTTPDVSSRHVNLSLGNDGVILENLSSRVTKIDDDALAMGDRKPLIAGQVVSLGGLVKFTLEALPDAPAAKPAAGSPQRAPNNDDDATTPPPSKGAPMPKPAPASNDDDATTPPPAPKPAAKSAAPIDNDATVPPAAAPKPTPRPAPAPAKPAPKPAPKPMPTPMPTPTPTPAPAGADSANETIAMQTRMASAEELEYMKSSHEKKKIRKTGLWLFLLVVIIGGLIGAYYAFLYKAPEKVLSWPKDEAGKELSEYAKMEGCPYVNDLQVKYPNIPGADVESSSGKLVIKSALGKYRDVPLRLTMEYFQDKSSLTVERTATLEKWMASKTTGSENWNFDLIQPIAFYQSKHGIPYLSVPYSRTEDNESFVGYAIQIRMADWVFILMKEIPTRDRWRAEWYIQQVAFLAFSPKFLENHWEGTDDYQKGNPAAIVAEAKSLLRSRTPTVWPKAQYLLRSALCQAQAAGDAQVVADAVELVRELRDSQMEYFNQEKITYLLAKNQKNDKEMKRISAELRAVFSSEEDYRFHKIRQNKWD
ncbi:MAG: FHA domain-containing protein [Victivallales bacterium]|nr:FHA domain-containing protein [Victivallales bacterium]